MCRILAFVQLVRLRKFPRALSALDRYFSVGTMRMWRITFVALALLHVTACLFFMMADIAEAYGHFTWLDAERVIHKSMMVQYFHALYWVRCHANAPWLII